MNIFQYTRLTVLILLAISAVTVRAEESTKKQMAAFWPTMCETMAQNSLDDNTLRIFAKKGLITADQLCSCMTDKLKANPITADLFSEGDEYTTLKHQEFYLQYKAMAFVMQCTGDSLDRASETMVTK